jgi:replicative DNA helicase
VWLALIDMSDNDAPIDAVAVASWLRGRDKLEHIGGAVFLAELLNQPTLADPLSTARQIQGLFRIRSGISTCQAHAAKGYSAHDAEAYISQLEADVFELGGTQRAEDTPSLSVTIATQLNTIRSRSEPGKSDYCPTTLQGVNRLIHGWTNSLETIVAARPGRGKTAYAIQEMLAFAHRSHKAVVFFSLEQPAHQVAERMLCQIAAVDNSLLKTGRLSPDQWGSLAVAAERLSNLPIAVEDSGQLTVPELRSRTRRAVRRLQRKHGAGLELGLIVIDYIQLMSDTSKRHVNRESEISEVSRGIRAFIKASGVPGIVLCQLNRDLEKTKRDPILSDLRESGQIEQDAQVVMFLAEGKMIVAKCRDGGSTGTAPVKFDGPTLTFTDHTEEYDINYDDLGDRWGNQ